jgi:chitinase
VRRGRVVAVAGGAAVVLGAAGAFVAVSAPSASAAVNRAWYGAAAYVMPLDNNPPDLGAVMSATGQKTFELAFVLSGGGCTPAWDGTASLSDPTIASVISTVRANGGDVSVSFGGYGGTKLGQTCSDPASTASAYQQVISKYGLKAVDFDLEEPEYENSAAIHNEIGAAKILQQNNSGLYVSITTAGTTSGTGYFGGLLLDEAKSQGFTPDNYSIMPFDGGFSGSSAQTSALESFHSLLMSKFGWDSATAYGREGVSLMNGRSDSGEMFPQSAFQDVLNYVQSHGLTRYTYWSVNRDRQCVAPETNDTTHGDCSSVAQAPWDFTKFTAKFGGAVPPPPPPPSPTPSSSSSSSGGGTCTAAQWNATTAYVGGSVVSWNGHKYTAKWWTQGEQPDTHSGQYDVWTDNGACSGGTPGPSTSPSKSPTPGPSPSPSPSTTKPPSPSPTGSGQYPAWQANHFYNVGDRVSYGGHNYQCIQAHTSQVGWEPPNVPALWQFLS